MTPTDLSPTVIELTIKAITTLTDRLTHLLIRLIDCVKERICVFTSTCWQWIPKQEECHQKGRPPEKIHLLSRLTE